MSLILQIILTVFFLQISVRPSTSFSADTDVPILPLTDTDTDMLHEWMWHGMTESWKVFSAAACYDSGGESVSAVEDAFDLSSILGWIIVPNDHTGPTDMHDWAWLCELPRCCL